MYYVGFPGGVSGKASAFTTNKGGKGFDSWVRKILWRRAWQPTSLCLPGESHGQRHLVGYSPWACRVGHNLVTKPPPPNNSYLPD